MPKFKVGDVVIINKPVNVTEFPEWLEEMNYLNNTPVKITKIVKAMVNEVIFYSFQCKDGWSINVNWCEKAPILAKTLYE